jgi:hypothetical protein
LITLCLWLGNYLDARKIFYLPTKLSGWLRVVHLDIVIVMPIDIDPVVVGGMSRGTSLRNINAVGVKGDMSTPGRR